MEKPRRDARNSSRDAGLEALAPRSPVSKDEQATIAKRKREAGSASRATPGATKRQPETRDGREAGVAVGGSGRRDRGPTVRREVRAPEGPIGGRGRRGFVAREGRTSDVAVNRDGRREQEALTGRAYRGNSSPMLSRRNREPDESNEDGPHRGGGVGVRRDAREPVRRSRLQSREVPAVPGLDLQSALAYVEQHLPGLNALIGRGRGRGRPRGRAASSRMTRAGHRRVNDRAGLGYDEEDGDL